MSCLFQECSSLKELSLNSFNTNNVTNFNCMFYECYSLNELNLFNFNTYNLTSMNHMLSRCSDELKKKIKEKNKK